MTMLHPYLNFNGDCEQAFDLYRSVFGGEYEVFSRFSDMPPDPNFPVADEDKNRIMHVSLPIGDDAVLMGSDVTSGMGEVQQGNAFSISIAVKSEAEADRVFAALSEGGEVTMPLAKMFWNSYFGMCTDRFGVQWMVNHDYAQS